MRALRGLLLTLLIAAGVRSSNAKGWPTPAAGMSPNGDVEILFTFDDGPNPATTPKVLDILRAHGVHAVFFLVGEMVEGHKQSKAILQRILDEGHVIANHTQTHADLCSKRVTDEKAAREIDQGKKTIEEAIGMEILWFRAPYGSRCDRLEGMLSERHLEHFHWDLDPQEWRHGDVDKTVKYVIGEISRAGGRAVLLMHDIKPVTVKALPQIFAWIDEENARRTKSHKRKIKILGAPEFALEHLPPEHVAWFDEATAGIRGLPQTIASVLP